MTPKIHHFFKIIMWHITAAGVMRSFSAVFYFATDNYFIHFIKNQFILLYFGGWSYYRLQQKHKMPSNISDPAQAWEQPASSSPTSMVFSPPVPSTLAGMRLLRWRSNEAASSLRHSVADCGSYSVQSREEKCDSCRLQFEWGRWRYPSGWTRECSTCASPFPESCGCGVSDVESSTGTTTLLRLKDLKRRPHRRWHRLALETCHLPQCYLLLLLRVHWTWHKGTSYLSHYHHDWKLTCNSFSCQIVHKLRDGYSWEPETL